VSIYLRKLANGTLAGATEADQEALKRFKLGATLRCEIKQQRNYQFHRKFFALCQFAFDLWSEGNMPLFKGERVQPQFERFRHDLVILAGYYHPVVAINGEVRVEADSIAFSSMDEATFETCFSNVINVILGKVLPNKNLTEEKLRQVVDELLEFS